MTYKGDTKKKKLMIKIIREKSDVMIRDEELTMYDTINMRIINVNKIGYINYKVDIRCYRIKN